MIEALERGSQLAQAGETIRHSSFLRLQDIKNLSTRVELGKEQLQNQMQKSLNYILNEQHPVSHLFPAATSARQDKENHYQDAWVRDLSMIGLALFDPLILELYPKEEELGKRIRSSGPRLIEGMLNLFGREPWNSAFEQDIKESKDQWGRTYTHLVKEAPPIHSKVDGKDCVWPTQNQPDCWGEFLIATASGIKEGIVKLGKDKKKTLDKIASYLIRAQLDRFKQYSMWEWGEVYQPAPLSTVALCAMGLEEISPHLLDGVKEPAKLEAKKLQAVAANLYPNEYTVPSGHESKTDLATLVAFSVGALNGHSFIDYADIADKELGNGEYPGKKRYKGDHYHRTDQEAIWFMGSLMEAKVCLELRDLKEEVGLREKGLNSLRRAKAVYDHYGYSPELFRIQDGVLVPSKNHLLWSEALMAQASSRALVLV